MKKYHFFYGGICSNWAKSWFTLDKITYSCMEQFMMYQKALIMKDHETADKIMRTDSPKLIKQLGREVKNFDNKLWDEVKYDVVKRGVFAKFKQNEHLAKELLDIECEQFVEASPFDRIWGIGFNEYTALKVSESKWGQNLLGKIITEVRDELKVARSGSSTM